MESSTFSGILSRRLSGVKRKVSRGKKIDEARSIAMTKDRSIEKLAVFREKRGDCTGADHHSVSKQTRLNAPLMLISLPTTL